MTQLTDMTDAVDSAHQRKTLRQVGPIRGVRRVRPTRFVHAVVVCAALIAFAACGGGGGQIPARAQRVCHPYTAPLQLVAIGDSIPNNSPDDCPGCQGFVDRYAAAIQRHETAGHGPKSVRAQQPHVAWATGRTADLKDQLGAADIIVVAIAHNSMELNADVPAEGQ